MMIYLALRWPEHNERDMWPLALSHAVHLHNKLPSMTSRLTPHEIWSRSKSSYIALLNSHPWGCPVYVLQPQLQDGRKLPKWARSRQDSTWEPLHYMLAMWDSFEIYKLTISVLNFTSSTMTCSKPCTLAKRSSLHRGLTSLSSIASSPIMTIPTLFLNSLTNGSLQSSSSLIANSKSMLAETAMTLLLRKITALRGQMMSLTIWMRLPLRGRHLKAGHLREKPPRLNPPLRGRRLSLKSPLKTLHFVDALQDESEVPPITPV
jgi:hypothetical protein